MIDELRKDWYNIVLEIMETNLMQLFPEGRDIFPTPTMYDPIFEA